MTDSDVKHPYYYQLMEMFPDICPKYLHELCLREGEDSEALDDLVSHLLTGTYRRRKKDPENDFDLQYSNLLDLFPDADPSYLRENCERLIKQPEKLEKFITYMLENKPFLSNDHCKKSKVPTPEKLYTTEFNVEKYLEIIPDPEGYFEDPERKISWKSNSDSTYALLFLQNHYPRISTKRITHAFSKAECSVVKASKILNKMTPNRKEERRFDPITGCKNIPLLQEIAYVQHKNEILACIKLQQEKNIQARKRVKENELMKTCGNCFEKEVMPSETATCVAGHMFCKECVRTWAEIEIGEGKLEFPCLKTCGSQFSLQVLQTVLAPKVFSKLIQRKQSEEVKAAGIEDLEFCPFCDFATIPAPGDKIFQCLNDECMMETCRSCLEPAHIPFRCEEMEKESEVKVRTYIEDKMTEALIRKCYKCGLKFIKESGCNKMTCSCGAMMCYVCKKPVQNYNHFSQNSSQPGLCPLYSDMTQLHKEAVKRSAENAKQEMGIDENNKLKVDPTKDLDRHYSG